MRSIFGVLITVILAGCTLFGAQGDKSSEDPLAGATVLKYKTIADGKDLNMYIFSPEGHKASDKVPAMVFFFGGGWNGGGPEKLADQAKYIASRGMVAMCADYRTKSSHGTTPFECVKDAKSAVRWVRKNAKELGIDPDRIVASGGSAGGHIAAATATVAGFDEDEDKTVSCVPNALVLFNPVFDNGPEGYGYERVKEHYKEFSPIDNIKKGLVPSLVMLGTKDRLIPVKTAERFKELAEKAGSRCDLKLYEDQGHGFFNKGKGDSEMYVKTIYDMDVFLASLGYLKGEPTIKADMAGSGRK